MILKENVGNLGRIGDVIKVSDGYARNYLLPNGLVVIASKKNEAEFAHCKRILDKKRQSQKLLSEEMAKKLNEFTCIVKKRVGEKEKLFGSVSTGDISVALKEAGIDIDKKIIQLDAPIKNLGLHTVKVKLESDVVAQLKVSVVKDE
ncbi:MAG: 50S ribosomal protein L9 [Bdellovibrio sp.]|nr:50S ribosomal protein L9 [Bdellovibrio sp.]